MKTLYEVLRVDRQASITDIAQRYRHHLNRHVLNGQQRTVSKKDQRRLQEMREAYLLLTSPSRRRAYDQQIARLERARQRWTARIGISVCVAMLVAGAALIVHGYVQMQEKTLTAQVHTARADKAASETLPETLTALAGTMPPTTGAQTGQ